MGIAIFTIALIVWILLMSPGAVAGWYAEFEHKLIDARKVVKEKEAKKWR